jgi:phage protein D
MCLVLAQPRVLHARGDSDMVVRTPFYHIKMGGEKVAQDGEDITPWVNSVTVVEDDQQADNVTITIADPRMIYADALFEGSWVEVDMGYAEANQHAVMLRAIITKVDQSYPDNGVPTLSLKGEDKSILMGLEEKKKVWRDRKVTDIAREIGQKNGFKHIEAHLNSDPMIKSKPINQDGKTDLAFLQELAKTYHAKCFVELNEQAEEVLYFIPERRVVTLNRPDRLVLRYRLGPKTNLVAPDCNLLNFSPSFDSNYIDRLKEVSDVDTKGQKIKSQDKPSSEMVVWELDEVRMAQANARDQSKIRQLYTKGAAQKRELQKKLMTRRAAVGHVAPDQGEIESTNDALESRRLGMMASGSTFGNIWLRAKSNITIAGVNNRFNGEWYVSSVTHKVDNGGYKTDFKCIR